MNGSSTTTDAARAAAAAAATLLSKQLTTAESVVMQATSQLELMRALVDQARAVANEATRCRATLHDTLAVARRACAMAIDTVDVAIVDEAQCIAELNAADMDTVAATKNQLALGAQELFESATRAHKGAVHSLNSLREVLATNLFHLPLSSASFICLSDYRLLSRTLKNFANHNLAAFMHTCVHACGDQRLCLGVSRTNVQSAM